VKRILSIAGSDSSAGGGVQGDLKAFARCGVYGTTALTAVTAGNTREITDVLDLPPEFVTAQIEAIVSDIGADAVKTGMLSNAAIASAVAGAIRRLGLRNVVVDPVIVAENGAMLLKPDALDALTGELFPLADVVTPNVPEAFALVGEEADEGRLRECAAAVKDLGPAAVVITGGNTANGSDLLYDGRTFTEIKGPVHPKDTAHGAGCAHSSALAAFLARGLGLEEAARGARVVASEAVRFGLQEIGDGPGPVHSLGSVLERRPGDHREG
jgi:hydroxymethylpyrimidine/phosphomethylpyrimidine kinase